jgi:4-amino-4-deoxy-L-arabinose transferase-like glycosyltransferase
VTLLVVLSLIVKLAMLYLFSKTVYFEMLEIDMKSYHLQALEIVGGKWLPHETFYQSPLYGYFLAFLYALFGKSLWVPRLANVLLGTANVVLVYAIGTRLFSKFVGIGAAVFLMFYGPMLLEETAVIKTPLIISLLLSGLAIVLWHAHSGSRFGMLAAGLLVGTGAMGAGQALGAIPVLAIVVGSSWWNGSNPTRVQFALWFLAGCLLPIIPVSAWNTHKGGGFLLTSADAGLNLYIGNNPSSSGLPTTPIELLELRAIPEYEPEDSKRIAEKESGRALTTAGVSRYWSGRAVAFMLNNPGTFLSGLAKKFEVFWNFYEIPDDYHYSFIRYRFLPTLWAFPTFVLIGPLALFGLIVHVRQWRELLPLYGVFVSYLALVVLFYIRGRYRMVAVPMLAIFAAAGIEWLLRVWRDRRHREIFAFGAATLGLATFFVNRTYSEPAEHGFPAISLSGSLWYDDRYLQLADWFRQKGSDADLKQAIAYIDEGLQFKTNRVSSEAELHFQRGLLSVILGKRLIAADARHEAGSYLREAEAAFERCIGLGFRKPDAQSQLDEVRRLLQGSP